MSALPRNAGNATEGSGGNCAYHNVILWPLNDEQQCLSGEEILALFKNIMGEFDMEQFDPLKTEKY